MSLFFDHPLATVRRELSRRNHLPAPDEISKARVRRAMPDHVCVRVVGGWLGTLAALCALVLALRWYA